MSTISEQFADFTFNLQYEDIPKEVIERVRLHTLDIIGICLLNADEDFAKILRATVSHSDGTAESTLIGSGGLKLQAPLAALYNSGIAHGNEFDDTYAPGRWHGSAPTVPPTLAVAEMLHISGKAFITALAIGLEVGCRLTRAAPTILYQGFHSTSTAGIFAAAMAVGKLMSLNSEQLANAMGICGSFASGTSEFLSDPEPWSKRIQVGYAGHSAIIAVRAAFHGFKGPRTILEGRYGYFRSYAHEGNFDLSQLTEAMGTDWQVLHLYPKRYPCDHIAQGYIDCAIALSRVKAVTPRNIELIECIVHPLVVPVMFEPRDLRYRPINGLSARLSMPFNIAVALIDHALTIDSYTDERLQDKTIHDLMDKVTYIEEASLVFPNDYPAWVRLYTKDDRVFEHKILKVIGSPQNPMPPEDYENKFINNACRSIDTKKATEIVNLIRDLPYLPDIAQLADLYR